MELSRKLELSSTFARHADEVLHCVRAGVVEARRWAIEAQTGTADTGQALLRARAALVHAHELLTRLERDRGCVAWSVGPVSSTSIYLSPKTRTPRPRPGSDA